jgi:hypothetical protein
MILRKLGDLKKKSKKSNHIQNKHLIILRDRTHSKLKITISRSSLKLFPIQETHKKTSPDKFTSSSQPTRPSYRICLLHLFKVKKRVLMKGSF